MAQLFTLDNGLRGVCETIPGAGKVTMTITIKTGIVNEAPEENGLTNLTIETMMRGTATRKRAELAEEVESKGGGINCGIDKTVTTFGGEAFTRHAAATFDILADVLRNPLLDTKEVQFVAKQTTQGLKRQQESPGAKARLGFAKALYGEQSAGQNPLGSADLLASFTPDQVRAKHAELLSDPSRIVVSFAGEIDAATAEEMVKKHFADLTPNSSAKPDPQVFVGGDIRESTNHEQMSITFGFPAPSKKDDDRFAVFLLEELLAGSMSAPLFQEIREKRGLVYSVGASYAPSNDAGVFAIGAGTGKGKAGELVQASLDLLGSFIKNGFSAEDVEIARNRILRSRKDLGVSASGAKNASHLLEFDRLIPEAEFEYNLKQVKPDDIRRVMGEMLQSGNYALSSVGPQDSLQTPDEIRALMKKQLDGIALPLRTPKPPSARPAFAAAAEKTSAAEAVPQTTILPNGIRIISQERPGNLSCGIWVGVGSDHEPKEINGASHMMEHMMFKGTPSFPPGKIDSLVEKEFFGDLNAYTSNDRTCYYFYNVTAEAMPTLIKLGGEMVFMADLDDEQFDGKKTVQADGTIVKSPGERDVVLEEIKRSKDNLGRMMFETLSETAFPDQPHSRTTLGPYEVIAKMTAQEMRDYRDTFYVPNNTIFCSVGPVKHEDLVKEVSGRFGHLQPKAFPDLPIPHYVGGVCAVEEDKAQVCTVLLGAPAPASGTREEAAYTALAMVLGDGMSARLTERLVDEANLASAMDTGCMNYRNGGLFVIIGKTEAEKSKALVDGIYSELRAVRDGMTADELDKIKATMEMNRLGQFESNRDACNMYARMAQDYGRTITLVDLAREIQGITLDDVKRAADEVLRAKPTGTFVVPKGTDMSLLPTIEGLIAARDGMPPSATAPQPNASGPAPKA